MFVCELLTGYVRTLSKMVPDRNPEKECLPLDKALKTLGINTGATARIISADFWKQRELERRIGLDRRRDQGLGL
ncbi:MAG: hypothetical protein F4Z37_12475 [Rhodothermaceae bacterium]|nr:hypothetical protein [Rhodothermaceae bacterium]